MRARMREMSGTRRGMSSNPDLFGERRDRDFVTVADIEDLSDRAGFVDQGYHSPHHIADVGEAAGLRAIAEHGDWLPGERLPDEVRNHHPVLAGLTRSDGVEQTDDDDRKLPLLPIGERKEFVDQLAARVRPAVLRALAEHHIGVLAERHVHALAIHLRRRRNQHELFLFVGVLEHDLRAVDVGLDGVNRLLDDELHADRGRQMHDDVAAVDQLGKHRLVRNRVDRVMETGVTLQVNDVVDRSRRQIVEDEHFVAAFEQRLGQMASDEARAARDENPHHAPLVVPGSVSALAGRVSATIASAARTAASPVALMPTRRRYTLRARSSCRRNCSSYRI